MNARRLLGLAAAFMAVVWGAPASADQVVYSNLGPTNDYGGTATAGVGGGAAQGYAGAFTPNGNFELDSIAVGITSATANLPIPITLSLELSSATGLPDNMPIATFNLPNVPGRLPLNVGTIQPSQMVVATSPLELLDATKYWLVATSPSAGVWWPNNQGAINSPGTGIAFRFGTGTWTARSDFLLPAFAVRGTPVVEEVPEPATLGLTVLGLLGVGLARRKRPN